MGRLLGLHCYPPLDYLGPHVPHYKFLDLLYSVHQYHKYISLNFFSLYGYVPMPLLWRNLAAHVHLYLYIQKHLPNDLPSLLIHVFLLIDSPVPLYNYVATFVYKQIVSMPSIYPSFHPSLSIFIHPTQAFTYCMNSFFNEPALRHTRNSPLEPPGFCLRRGMGCTCLPKYNTLILTLWILALATLSKWRYWRT